MDVPRSLRAARRRAGLSQAALAARVGTSQATLSAYESGRKAPSIDTLTRLLAATGARLAIEPAGPAPIEPGLDQLARRGRVLLEVLALAEALPVKRPGPLRFPRLPGGRQPAMPA